MIETQQLTESANFGATAIVLLLCAALVVAFLRSQRSTHTPTVQPRVSRDDLNRCAAIARRFFEERA